MFFFVFFIEGFIFSFFVLLYKLGESIVFIFFCWKCILCIVLLLRLRLGLEFGDIFRGMIDFRIVFLRRDMERMFEREGKWFLFFFVNSSELLLLFLWFFEILVLFFGEMLIVRGVLWLIGCLICVIVNDVFWEGLIGIFEKDNFVKFEYFLLENSLLFVVFLVVGWVEFFEGFS